MGIIYTDVNVDPYKSGQPIPGGEDTGVWENMRAAYRAQDAFAKGDASRNTALEEVFAPLRQKAIDRANLSNVDRLELFGADSYNQYAFPASEYSKYFNNTLKYIQEHQDQFPEDEFKNLSFAELEKQAIDVSNKRLTEQQDISSRKTAWGGVGEIVGDIAGSMSSMDVLSMAIPEFKAPTVVWPIVNRMFQNTVINTGVEAIKYPEVKSWSEKVTGKEYGWEEFLQHEKDVALGTIALTGAFEGIAKVPFRKGYTLTKDKMIEGIETLQNAYAKKFGDNAEIKDTVLKEVDVLKSESAKEQSIVDSNPLDNDAGDIEHKQRLQQTAEALSTKNFNRLPDDNPSSTKPITDIHHFERNNGTVKFYNPKDIKVDAETFQFKSGGDVYGVSERLQGVTEWDPISANTAIVYEKANGETFIVDGHQRLGLAKRIMEKDPSQNIEIIAFPLRELDGISQDQARVIAAFKNIGEGTGTAVDAAKVLKTSPELIGKLPPTSQLVIQGRGLANLSDEAFMLIVNETIPANYGALVGRIMSDHTEQMAAIEMLKRLDVSNANQAEAIIRQMKETGFVKSTQTSLFGDEVVAESLFLERAKILDTASKILKSDKQLFKSLVDNAAKIEESGNVLNKFNNTSNEETYAKAIQIIKANANTKGSISESLTRLAREFKEGGSKGLQRYARQFTDDVARAVEDGNFNRIETSGTSIDDAVAKEADKINETRINELSLFDDGINSPGAKAETQTLLTTAKEELQMAPEMNDVVVHVDDIDPNTGMPVSRTVTAKQIMDEIAQDDKALNRLKGCT